MTHDRVSPAEFPLGRAQPRREAGDIVVVSESGDDSGDGNGGGAAEVAALVEQPAKVMRIGSMIKQLLEEVRSARWTRPRRRLAEIHSRSIAELEDGLAPELVAELGGLSLPSSMKRCPPTAGCGSPRLNSWVG